MSGFYATNLFIDDQYIHHPGATGNWFVNFSNSDDVFGFSTKPRENRQSNLYERTLSDLEKEYGDIQKTLISMGVKVSFRKTNRVFYIRNYDGAELRNIAGFTYAGYSPSMKVNFWKRILLKVEKLAEDRQRDRILRLEPIKSPGNLEETGA